MVARAAKSVRERRIDVRQWLRANLERSRAVQIAHPARYDRGTWSRRIQRAVYRPGRRSAPRSLIGPSGSSSAFKPRVLGSERVNRGDQRPVGTPPACTPSSAR